MQGNIFRADFGRRGADFGQISGAGRPKSDLAPGYKPLGNRGNRGIGEIPFKNGGQSLGQLSGER